MTERVRLRDGFRYCLGVFLGVRLGLFVLSIVSTSVLIPLRTAPIPGVSMSPGWHTLLDATARQDAGWFLRIAEHGYATAPDAAAFFPLYPLAIRATSILTFGHEVVASLIVSNLAFLASLVVLFALTTEERSEAVARRTVLFLAVFPTAFFFLSPYSESLFLLCTLIAFRAARKGRWWLAAVAGSLAGLTRSVGILVAPALLVEGFQQWRREGRPPWRPVAAAAGALVGPFLYFLHWQIRSSDPLAPIHAQSGWQRDPANPIVTLLRGFDAGIRWLGKPSGAYWFIDAVIVSIVVGAAVIGIVRLRPAYSFYVWASLIVPLAYPFPDRPFLSVPRFVIVLFPVFWVLADIAERRKIPNTAVVGVSAGAYALLAALFMNWYHIF